MSPITSLICVHEVTFHLFLCTPPVETLEQTTYQMCGFFQTQVDTVYIRACVCVCVRERERERERERRMGERERRMGERETETERDRDRQRQRENGFPNFESI